MTPAELYDDHGRRPRNLGKLAVANAVGDIGSIVVGDALRFYITVADKRISAARFQVFNCQTMVASASAVSELAVGKTLDEAAALGAPDLCAHFGGLDYAALPAQPWGLEGLRAAVAALQGKDPGYDRERDPLLCRCFGVAEETVRQAITVAGHATVEAVGAATRAGTGCGSCQADIRRLFEEAAAPAAAPTSSAAAGGKPGGRIQLLLRIQRLVDERFVPEVRRGGGELELWDFDGQLVQVKLGGAAVGDPAARRKVLADLERALQSEIQSDLGVADAGGG